MQSELEILRHKNIKAITHIPGWAQELRSSRDTISSVEAAYASVPLVFRAVRLRCDALAAVPARLRTLRGKEQPWQFGGTPLRELLWRTEAALLFTGASYWLKKSNGVRVLDVEWLNPTTMRIDIQPDGSLLFKQRIGAKEYGPWTEDEIVYIRDFSMADDVGAGVASAQVAMQDAQLQHYMKRFVALYFEGGAMPITLLGFDTTPDKEEAERIEGFFKRAAAGIRNAWKVLALRSGITPTVLTQDLAKMAMPELDAATRRNIALAFGIPQTMLEDAANYATAAEHRMGFYEETIRPRAALIMDAVNAQLFAGTNTKFELALEELDIYQEDEAQRAGSLKQLTDAGIPMDMAMELLGYDLTEEQWQRIRDLVAQKQEASSALSHLAMNSAQQGSGGSASDAQDGKQDNKEQKAELARWERKACKRLKDGKSASCDFASAAIPDDLAQLIVRWLKHASTVEEVRGVFKTVAHYERQLRSAVLDYYRGDLDAGDFIDEMVRMITEQFTRAWNEGARDAGFDPSEMDDEDSELLEERIANEQEYVLDFASAIDAAREAQSGTAALYARASMWANRYNEVVSAARLHFAGDNEKLEWVYGDTVEHCATCSALAGVVARKKDWDAYPHKPQGSSLECGGYKCKCSLVLTTKRRTRGGIPDA